MGPRPAPVKARGGARRPSGGGAPRVRPRPAGADDAGGPRPPRDRDAEVKVCGRHACRALLARRPEQILRVYLVRELVEPFGDLLRTCARLRRPTRVVGADELERLTESRHHEGICVVAAAPPARTVSDVLRAPGPACVVALAGVANPHNTGAIVRTAAHFGVRAVLIEGEARRLPPAVWRTAQGGAEWVDVVSTPALAPALAEARRAGFTVCATSSHGGAPLYSAALGPRVVLVLGAEDEGVAPELASSADVTLCIPGSGHVESLNVASATAVLLSEVWRRRK
jgi:TrmH RNA methyltransferase